MIAKKSLIAVSILAAMSNLVAMSVSHADSKTHQFSKFKALDESANSDAWNPSAPWKLPKGFTQWVVSDETALNIYDGGRNDWHDMNTVNETGIYAGRYLYRTHELRFPGSQPEGGSVSVVDLETGETKVLVQDSSYDALDGIRWTPWGTLLIAEEKTGGRLFEITLAPDDLTTAIAVTERPAVGLLAHEGIDLDGDGNIYIVDEHRGRSEIRPERGNTCGGEVPCGGSIYKFVPDSPGDLSTGSLFALKVTGPDGTGQGEWVGPIDALNARASGAMHGGKSYQRPEDLEVIGDTLYVAITEGPRDELGDELYEGRVISINLDTLKVSNFVKANINVPVEIGKPGDEGHQTGFDSVDNLAETPDGNLMMIEDNKPSDIWVASTSVNTYGASESVKLFASLTDPGAEGTGIYFSPQDAKILYVNIQHSASEDGDGTWAITKSGRGHRADD